MHGARAFFRSLSKILSFGLLGAVLLLVRYFLKTPQPLKSGVSGNEHLYTWRDGHVFYTTSGLETAPPLLLLHSLDMGASSYEFRHVVAALAQDYHVYTLDLLGFALSDHPRLTYTPATYVSLCTDFLRDVVSQPATLVASGSSASIVSTVASQSTDLCRELVLLSPRTHIPGWLPSGWLATASRYAYLGLFTYALLTLRPVLRGIVAGQQGVPYTHISSYQLQPVEAAAHQLGAQHAAIAVCSDRFHISTTALESLMATIQQPLLLIQAEQEPPFPAPAGVTRVLCSSSGRVHEQLPIFVTTTIREWHHVFASTPITTSLTAPDTEPPFIPEPSLTTIHEQTLSEASEPEVVSPDLTTQTDKETPDVHEPSAESVPVSVTFDPSTTSTLAHEVAYCVKCRQKRTMQSAKKIMTKNGRHALEGLCPHCHTRLFRFIAG